MNEETLTLPLNSELWQQTLGWQPDATQQAQLQQVYDLVRSRNRQFNLTRITEPDEFWEKHLWDSLRGIFLTAAPEETEATAPVPILPAEIPVQVIDIGTGAGFPGIPVAIAFPHWKVTLLDATRKKVAFLDSLIETLSLSNLATVTARAEQLGRNPEHREFYDLALIRAVAAPTICAEYALPLLAPGGVAVLYRGQWTEAESQALHAAAAQLGGKVEHLEPFTTPLTQGIRHCIGLRKTALTPSAFPRLVGVPTQKPL